MHHFFKRVCILDGLVSRRLASDGTTAKVIIAGSMIIMFVFVCVNVCNACICVCVYVLYVCICVCVYVNRALFDLI